MYDCEVIMLKSKQNPIRKTVGNIEYSVPVLIVLKELRNKAPQKKNLGVVLLWRIHMSVFTIHRSPDNGGLMYNQDLSSSQNVIVSNRPHPDIIGDDITDSDLGGLDQGSSSVNPSDTEVSSSLPYLPSNDLHSLMGES